MKKSLVLILVLIVAVLAFGGCAMYCKNTGPFGAVKNFYAKWIGGPGASGGGEERILEEKAVDDYIRANISKLSPEKEVLGGKFYVTEIKFGENQTGEVGYEDGHIAFRAAFTYEMKDGNVSVKKFEIIPEPSQAFEKEGYLIQEEGADGWLFLYEEPGKPALRAMLVFSTETVCATQSGGDLPCDGWSNGDRVKVSGKKSGDKITVDRIEKLGI